jgi:hypothetical protein
VGVPGLLPSAYLQTNSNSRPSRRQDQSTRTEPRIGLPCFAWTQLPDPSDDFSSEIASQLTSRTPRGGSLIPRKTRTARSPYGIFPSHSLCLAGRSLIPLSWPSPSATLTCSYFQELSRTKNTGLHSTGQTRTRPQPIRCRYVSKTKLHLHKTSSSPFPNRH